MRVKEDSGKAGLKLNIQKTKIMASGPTTSWQIDGHKEQEKVLNITNHQGDANQNHSKILSHRCQDGYYQKDKKQ